MFYLSLPPTPLSLVCKKDDLGGGGKCWWFFFFFTPPTVSCKALSSRVRAAGRHGGHSRNPSAPLPTQGACSAGAGALRCPIRSGVRLPPGCRKRLSAPPGAGNSRRTPSLRAATALRGQPRRRSGAAPLPPPLSSSPRPYPAARPPKSEAPPTHPRAAFISRSPHPPHPAAAEPGPAAGPPPRRGGGAEGGGRAQVRGGGGPRAAPRWRPPVGLAARRARGRGRGGGGGGRGPAAGSLIPHPRGSASPSPEPSRCTPLDPRIPIPGVPRSPSSGSRRRRGPVVIKSPQQQQLLRFAAGLGARWSPLPLTPSATPLLPRCPPLETALSSLPSAERV